MKTGKVILIFILAPALIFLYGAWNVFGPTLHNADKKFIYIKTGSDYQDVKDNLVKNNIIKNIFWFDEISKYADYPNKIKAGKYKVTDGMSLYDVVKMLRSGRQVA